MLCEYIYPCSLIVSAKREQDIYTANKCYRCKRLVAAFEVEHEALQQNLERAIKEEPARLVTSCDDVTRLCRVRMLDTQVTIRVQVSC